VFERDRHLTTEDATLSALVDGTSIDEPEAPTTISVVDIEF
jgi:hypothetical protein